MLLFLFFNSKWFEFSRVSDLSRCFLAFYVVALVVFLLAFIFGLVVCCWRRSKWAYIAGLCAYIAGNDTVRHAPIFYLSVTKREIIFACFLSNEWIVSSCHLLVLQKYYKSWMVRSFVNFVGIPHTRIDIQELSKIALIHYQKQRLLYAIRTFNKLLTLRMENSFE